ncbi:MAG: hypothetical protein JNK04_02370 [Myxococcales bacterium]|nr:hypothetical protein [Myxococcales bacterium]
MTTLLGDHIHRQRGYAHPPAPSFFGLDGREPTEHGNVSAPRKEEDCNPPLMAVKGTDICLRVEANAAQDAKGTGFDSKWKHDVFDVGTVVARK